MAYIVQRNLAWSKNLIPIFKLSHEQFLLHIFDNIFCKAQKYAKFTLPSRAYSMQFVFRAMEQGTELQSA
jgi:hypothetical protein